MAKKELKLKPDKKSQLTPELRTILKFGEDLFGHFDDLGLSKKQLGEKIDELWKIHGEEVAAHFITKFPGQRPRLWWKHNSPEARAVVDLGDGSGAAEQKTKDLALLIRNGLLSPAEEKALEKELDEIKQARAGSAY